MCAMIRKSAPLGAHTVTIETGRMAKQAGGSVIVSTGDTSILVTACVGPHKETAGFFPLSVEYIEKFYASGRIPGGFKRREGQLSEAEILTCRLSDRPLRPLFPEGFKGEVQVIAQVISHDSENDADVLSITGASAALMLSNAPFSGPIAAVRVGRIEGKFVANPLVETKQMVDDHGRFCFGEPKTGDALKEGKALLARGTVDLSMLDARVEELCSKILLTFPDCTTKTLEELRKPKLEAWDKNKENSRAWLALNMMTEARAGFTAFNEGTKEDREADFVLLRQKLAAGESWVGPLHDSIQPKAKRKG